MPSLVEHLERHFGQIECGWSVSADGDPMAFQVVRFRGTGVAKPVPYGTLGLSKIPLISPVSGKEIRQELIFLAPPEFGDRNIPAILQNVAAEALGLERAYLRGDLIGPRSKLFDGLAFTALYVSVPVYFPDSLQTFVDDGGRAIVFAWLVPITGSEAKFVEAHGWGEFEEVLEHQNPDLVNFAREAVA